MNSEITEIRIGDMLLRSGRIGLGEGLSAQVVVTGYVNGNNWWWLWHLNTRQDEQPDSSSGGTFGLYRSPEDAWAAAVQDLEEKHRRS